MPCVAAFLWAPAHDAQTVCHSERSEESNGGYVFIFRIRIFCWILRCAQNDKGNARAMKGARMKTAYGRPMAAVENRRSLKRTSSWPTWLSGKASRFGATAYCPTVTGTAVAFAGAVAAVA